MPSSGNSLDGREEMKEHLVLDDDIELFEEEEEEASDADLKVDFDAAKIQGGKNSQEPFADEAATIAQKAFQVVEGDITKQIAEAVNKSEIDTGEEGYIATLMAAQRPQALPNTSGPKNESALDTEQEGIPSSEGEQSQPDIDRDNPVPSPVTGGGGMRIPRGSMVGSSAPQKEQGSQDSQPADDEGVEGNEQEVQSDQGGANSDATQSRQENQSKERPSQPNLSQDQTRQQPPAQSTQGVTRGGAAMGGGASQQRLSDNGYTAELDQPSEAEDENIIEGEAPEDAEEDDGSIEEDGLDDEGEPLDEEGLGDDLAKEQNAARAEKVAAEGGDAAKAAGGVGETAEAAGAAEGAASAAGAAEAAGAAVEGGEAAAAVVATSEVWIPIVLILLAIFFVILFAILAVLMIYAILISICEEEWLGVLLWLVGYCPDV